MSAPAPKKFQLKINSGQLDAPERIIVYGTPGIGKTTLVARAPGVVFLDLEGGSSNFDVARIDDVRTFEDLLAAVNALVTEPHEFQTLVIDTLDRAEWLCWQSLCKRAGVTSIEQIGKGYGKGFTAAYEEFRKLFAAIENLWRTRKMHVFVLAHARLENVKNPSGPDYGRYTLKVHEKIAGMFLEACDAALFAHWEVYYNTDESRAKAVGTDRRLLNTIELPSHLAKNRHGLPSKIDLDWRGLVTLAAQGGRPELLRATIRDRARLLGGDAPKRVETSIKQSGADAAKLIELLDRLDAKLAGDAPPAAPAPAPTTDPTAPSAPAETTTTTTTATTTENAQ